jgi:hypothetical protein
MNRGRTIWLAVLLLGLVASFFLGTSRSPRSAPDPRALASGTARSADETGEVEIEVADPSEVGIRPPSPASGVGPGATSESDVVNALGTLFQSDPERALVLAEDAEKRFGESPRAVERRLYEIKALVKLGRIGSARTKAERYLATYPSGPMADEVERLTGVHRRPD